MKLRILKDTRWDFGTSIMQLKTGGIREVESLKQCADLIKYGFAEEIKAVEIDIKHKVNFSPDALVQEKSIQSDQIENKAILSSDVENKTIEQAVDAPQPIIRRGRKAKQ